MGGEAGMSQPVVPSLEFAIEPLARIRDQPARNRNAFTPESWRRLRDQQARDRFAPGREVREPGIHDLASRQAQRLEAVGAEADAEPATDRRLTGNRTPRFPRHPGRTRAAPLATEGPKLIANTVRKSHGG